MRIIEKIRFNLNKIKFKETKSYLDNLLDKYDWSYKSMVFSMLTGTTEKAFKAFPTLKKYDRSLPYRSAISSVSNEGFHIDKADESELCRLIAKIPNPINFGFIDIFLDNIDWYGENKESTLENVYDGHISELYGNNIRLKKEFDFGNKLNPLWLSIDRTTDTGDVREYPCGFENFLAELGKPTERELLCIFPAEQKENFENKKKEISSYLKSRYIIESYDLSAKNDEEYIMAKSEPLSGFSPKAIFSKEAKAHGYACVKSAHGTVYTKTNGHNHTFSVDITRPLLTRLAFAELEIVGYNFRIHTSLCDNDILLDSENTARVFAKRIFDIVDRAINDIEQVIYEGFGDTPKWYIDNI